MKWELLQGLEQRTGIICLIFSEDHSGHNVETIVDRSTIFSGVYLTDLEIWGFL